MKVQKCVSLYFNHQEVKQALAEALLKKGTLTGNPKWEKLAGVMGENLCTIEFGTDGDLIVSPDGMFDDV